MPSYRVIPIQAPGGGNHETPDDGRRRFLKAMAASAALATAGCSKGPPEPILPYVDMPEGMVPGQPVFYASTLVRRGYGIGVLVKTEMGRPIKIEGNARHPASLGATDAQAQAAILQLWDPDRSRTVMRGEQIATWEGFQSDALGRLQALERNGGAGLRLLTGSITSPTLLAQIDRWRKRYPNARWHRHDPLRCAAADSAAQTLFGQGAIARYRLEQAALVVTLDADFLSFELDSVRNARDFMQRRRGALPRNRLYAVESTPGLCGVLADSRLALSPPAIDALLRRLAEKVGAVPAAASPDPLVDDRWAAALAEQLKARRGASLVMAGPTLSADSHALAWRMNQYLGNIGRSIEALADDTAPHTLAELTADMHGGAVDMLIMLDVNPAYDAPATLGFPEALARVACSIHMGLYHDETAHVASWHIPQVHDLETWSDALSPDGTASIVQPLIAPLYGGRSPHTLMALLSGDTQFSAHEQVQAVWRARWQTSSPAEFESRWKQALREGVAQNDAARILSPRDVEPGSAPPPKPAPSLVAVFQPDHSAGAGEFSNNAWLQELPRPLSKITWDNAALMSPRTAQQHGLGNGDIVNVRAAGSSRSIDAPVWILPEHADHTLTLPLGYGRRNAGTVGNDIGFNAYAIQGSDAAGAPLRSIPVELRLTGRRHDFARTQNHMDTEGRDLVRLTQYSPAAGHGRPPEGAPEVPEPGASAGIPRPPHASLYPPVDYSSYAWGMSVDLDSCIGCNACTVACQSENNIPVVGKEEVARGHEMHWIRIDLYRDETAGRTMFQPVPCMHCENAPCELVCPVGATVHDSEGLNVQVYNRCVGTRFCSNNCPYKVRRFNFLKYDDTTHASSRARQNPEVTVRRRGVMEKCTYCLQRISHARIEAQKDGRPIADGDVVTACEAVCPTQAIVFGDTNDPHSRVSKAKASPRNYALLEEMNTRPRTTYLARIVDAGSKLDAEND